MFCVLKEYFIIWKEKFGQGIYEMLNVKGTVWKNKKRKRILLGILFIILLIIGFYFVEKRRLYQAFRSEYFEKNIVYDGQNYQYNDKLLTYLVMGVDPDEEGLPLSKGEADAIFLCVIDTVSKDISVISLNRNTMTPIDYYNDDGVYLVQEQAQLAIQHGFGSDEKQSSALQVSAVQRLLGGIPIQGYLTVDMGIIEKLNRAVDGVWVIIPEDMTLLDADFMQGREVCLNDEQAYWYVKYREIDSFASADKRLERQEQFLYSFIHEAMDKSHEDYRFSYQLYQDCKEHIYTNLSIDRILILSMMARNCEEDKLHFYSLPGDTIMGSQWEEFYVDEEELKRMIVDLFYETGASK